MHVFISAGEPSGDLHGANLARALRNLHPDIECLGFGGERMEAAGCQLLYPLSHLAVMGIAPVLAHVPVFLDLVSRSDRLFRHRRPDALVLIDYPGFNWWLARRAHFHGIPVFYFIPPQLWGWAGWRIKKVRRWVDHLLCPLPFEVDWYRDRGVQAHYVGHPYFDELPNQSLDSSFLAEQRNRRGTIVGLLPGSRTQEVENNLSTLIRSAARIHAEQPDTRFLVACFKPKHQEYIDARLQGRGLPIETCVGRTPEIIDLSRACVAVSGSVGLELLYRAKPTVVVYRVRSFQLQVSRWIITSPYISLVNLLAGKEVFPEYLSAHCEVEAVSREVLGWLQDAGAYEQKSNELIELRSRVAQPGACTRAAQYILSALQQKQVSHQAA